VADAPQLGARGGGWVVLQFALIAAVVVAGLVGQPWPEAARGTLGVIGAVLAFAGGALALVSARALGQSRSLTPFPRPLELARLVEGGPYRIVRHPMYSSGLLFFVGFSLAFSPWALLVTAVLAVVWGLKARVEERFLGPRYDRYAAYCKRTRYRLFPYVY